MPHSTRAVNRKATSTADPATSADPEDIRQAPDIGPREDRTPRDWGKQNLGAEDDARSFSLRALHQVFSQADQPTNLLPALQVVLEPGPGQAVDDASLLDPRPTRLGHPELREAQGRLVVGVGVYRDAHAGLYRLPDVGDGQVQPIRVGV